MSRNISHISIQVILATLLVTSGLVGSVAAADHSVNETEECEYCVSDDSTEKTVDVQKVDAGTDKVAATRVRKAFLQAKKAFHEARQEIQAIKKGDESPVEEVPSFFDDENDEDK